MSTISNKTTLLSSYTTAQSSGFHPSANYYANNIIGIKENYFEVKISLGSSLKVKQDGYWATSEYIKNIEAPTSSTKLCFKLNDVQQWSISNRTFNESENILEYDYTIYSSPKEIYSFIFNNPSQTPTHNYTTGFDGGFNMIGFRGQNQYCQGSDYDYSRNISINFKEIILDSLTTKTCTLKNSTDGINYDGDPHVLEFSSIGEHPTLARELSISLNGTEVYKTDIEMNLNSLTLPRSIYNNVLFGDNTFTITFKPKFKAESNFNIGDLGVKTYTIKFKKLIGELDVELANPILTDDLVRRVILNSWWVNSTNNLESKTIYVTNNYNDENPVWELLPDNIKDTPYLIKNRVCETIPALNFRIIATSNGNAGTTMALSYFGGAFD